MSNTQDELREKVIELIVEVPSAYELLFDTDRMNVDGVVGLIEAYKDNALMELLDRLENKLLDNSINLENEETAVKWGEVETTIQAERTDLKSEEK